MKKIIIEGYEIKTSLGMGFSIAEYKFGESEIFISFSMGQGGATAYGIILAQVDMGMNVKKGMVDSYEHQPLADAIYKSLDNLCGEAGWVGAPPALKEVILEGIKLVDPENA